MWILSFFTTELPEKAKRLKFYKDVDDGGGSQPFSEPKVWFYQMSW